MTIPKILNDLLDYEDLEKRGESTYIWVKKGKKEEAWAICSLLGMVVKGDFKIDGRPINNTYIFVKHPRDLKHRPGNSLAIGVEGRFHLRDLQIYFDQWETDNAT